MVEPLRGGFLNSLNHLEKKYKPRSGGGGGDGYPDLSGSTTKKHLFFVYSLSLCYVVYVLFFSMAVLGFNFPPDSGEKVSLLLEH